MKTLFAVAFLFLASLSQALDITTTDGETYRNCAVTKIEADTLTFSHADGSARISYAKLPEDLKRKHFDPAKVAQYRHQLQQANDAATAKAAAAQRERAEAVASAQREAEEQIRRDTEKKEADAREKEVAAQAAATRATLIKIVNIVGGALTVLFLIWFAVTHPASSLAVGGAGLAVYFLFIYDTSVPGDGGQRIHNQGLLQNRLLGSIGGMVVCVAGIGIAALRSNQPKD